MSASHQSSVLGEGSEPSRSVRFGVYAVDLSTGELRKSGIKIGLQDQPFRVLAALLERPGELLTKEDLREKVWEEDTYVDFDHALTTAVKKLRRALHDSAIHPRYIETLPKRGYRFIAPVSVEIDGVDRALIGGDTIGGVVADGPGGLAWADAYRRIRVQRTALLVLLCIAAAGAIAWAFWPPAEVGSPIVRKFSINPPSLFGRSRGGVGISPNGRYIAFATQGPDSAIWVRDIENERPRKLEESVGATSLFWSPDSETIAFDAGSVLKRVSVHGGPASTIGPLSGTVFVGGSWSPDGTKILASTGLPPVLYEFPAAGGSPRLAFDPGVLPSGGSSVHPQYFSGTSGRRVIAFAAGGPGDRQLCVRDLDSGEQITIGPGSNPRYSSSGHLIYQALGPEGGVWAMPFSVDRLEPLGPAFPIVETGIDPSVAADGTLLYVDAPSPGPQQLAMFNRAGTHVRRIGQPQDLIRSPSVSPDGERVVVQGFEQGNYDIWVHEIDVPVKSRISFDPTMDSYPVWMPGGARISWRFDRQGNADIFWRPLNRDAEPEPLIATPSSEIPADWCADGSCVVYMVSGLSSGIDIWYGMRKPDGSGFETKSFVESPFNEVNPRLSPDGRYLAYCSDESGTYEVYVRAFPEGRVATQISRNGGCQPRWSRESSELFYVERDTLVSAAVITNPEFNIGPLEELFRDQNLISTTPYRSTYDVTQDGTSVIFAERLEESGRESYRPQIHVLQNWAANFSPLPR